jgi:hypothetical protein
LHVSKGHFEGLSPSAYPRQHLQRGAFGSLYGARRKKRDVGREMGESGMQLAPEILDELSHWTSYIGDQGIPQTLHIQ